MKLQTGSSILGCNERKASWRLAHRFACKLSKGGYDKQSEGWKSLIESFGQASKYFLQYTRWSGDFDSQISMNPDSDGYKDFIARYKKNFDLKLTAEEQSLLSRGEKNLLQNPLKNHLQLLPKTFLKKKMMMF